MGLLKIDRRLNGLLDSGHRELDLWPPQANVDLRSISLLCISGNVPANFDNPRCSSSTCSNLVAFQKTSIVVQPDLESPPT